MPTSAAIYTRLSHDPRGVAPNIADQEHRCSELADAKGWTVVNVFTDRDRTAAGRDPVRPGYDDLCAAIKDGNVDGILALDQDRLVREPFELERLLHLCEDVGVTHLATAEGDLDLASPRDVMVARIKAAVSADEVATLRKRVRRAAERIAREGKVGGGGTRPLGYEADRVTVRPGEAALIKEAARRVLAGEALYAIASDWNRRGIKTVTGKQWGTTVLRRVLTAPRTAGLREHRGEVVGDAVWPGILDRGDWERLRAVLLDPSRRVGGRPRVYLLTGGLAVCGLCGAALVARPRGDGRRCYVCARGVGSTGCGKIRVLADPLEEEVRDRLLARLAGPGLRAALHAQADAGDHPDLYTELRRDEDRLRDLEVAHFTDGHLSKAGYLDARAKLHSRIEATRRALARLDRTGVLHDLPEDADALRARWDTADASWRRLVARAAVELVTVGPAVKGRNVFDPTRVNVTWRA